MLFGVEGLQVTDAQAGPDGTLEVWAITDYPAAAACPDCGMLSARRHDTVLAGREMSAGPVTRWRCGGSSSAGNAMRGLFHVVHLAVKMTGAVRRRVIRGKYGRRGRSGDPEYGIKSLLVRNLEHLSPGQFAKVTGTLQADPAGQEIAAAWIGKEKLRHALNLRARVTGSTPCERNVRDRLFDRRHERRLREPEPARQA